MRGMINIKLEE